MRDSVELEAEMPLIQARPVWDSSAAMEHLLKSGKLDENDYGNLPDVQSKLCLTLQISGKL